MTRLLLAGTVALACAATSPAFAAAPAPGSAKSFPDLKSIVGSLDTDYLSYGGSFGHRFTLDARTRVNMGPTKLAFGLSQGTRKAGGRSFHATHVEGSIVHDWTPRLSTATSAGIGSNEPVFVNRELSQDVSYKLMRSTVVTAGARYARYFGKVDSWSWSGGAAQYFPGGFISYRFTRYDTQGIGKTVGHRLSGKLADPYGATQLSFDHGTALHVSDAIAVPQKGHTTQVELQRSLSIGGGVSLSVAGRHSWNETAFSKFTGNGIRLGLTFGK